MSKKILGIAASPGIAIAKAFILENPNFKIKKKVISNPDEEIERLQMAIEQSKKDLDQIKTHTEAELGKDKAAIFAAHLLVLEDPELMNSITSKIKDEKWNTESAVNEVFEQFIQLFEQMDNEYMRERSADMRDVLTRLLAHLLGIPSTSLAEINSEKVIVAHDLSPSDTAQLNKRYVKGFATDIGGRTSHSAIMARSIEIPAVVGLKNITNEINADSVIIINGLDGHVVIDPTDEQVAYYEKKKAQYEQQKGDWLTLIDQKTETKEGHQVELAANIGIPDDVKAALHNGAEGIGLYRTEFLYMERKYLPTEEEQFEAYKSVLEQMHGKSVIIRTLDIGGDKELAYLDLPKELNPFLGYRAIRICLEEEHIFQTQLRALLRASSYGQLKIMFPMIATLEELRQAKAMLQEEKNKLIEQGTPVSDEIEVGMMIEIPSAAVLADRFAKEVDFFSIGTNDLIQYTLAADRMNEKVSYLYQPYHPAILRLIQMVVQAAHKEGKWAGMCGEMAGDPIAIPILLGLGLDEFSMSATSILPSRKLIRELTIEEIKPHVDKILSMDTADQVEQYVKHTFSLSYI